MVSIKAPAQRYRFHFILLSKFGRQYRFQHYPSAVSPGGSPLGRTGSEIISVYVDN
jgi:hypothetical protein